MLHHDEEDVCDVQDTVRSNYGSDNVALKAWGDCDSSAIDRRAGRRNLLSNFNFRQSIADQCEITGWRWNLKQWINNEYRGKFTLSVHGIDMRLVLKGLSHEIEFNLCDNNKKF